MRLLSYGSLVKSLFPKKKLSFRATVRPSKTKMKGCLLGLAIRKLLVTFHSDTLLQKSGKAHPHGHVVAICVLLIADGGGVSPPQAGKQVNFKAFIVYQAVLENGGFQVMRTYCILGNQLLCIVNRTQRRSGLEGCS